MSVFNLHLRASELKLFAFLGYVSRMIRVRNHYGTRCYGPTTTRYFHKGRITKDVSNFTQQEPIWSTRNPLVTERRKKVKLEELVEQESLNRHRASYHMDTNRDSVLANGSNESIVCDINVTEAVRSNRDLPYGTLCERVESPPLLDPPTLYVDDYTEKLASLWPRGGAAAVLIDIEGILVDRTNVPFPGAADSITLLRKHKIPFLLVANWCMSEPQVASMLAHSLDIPIYSEEIMLTHSPLRLLLSRYRETSALVIGPECAADILVGYGFRKVFQTKDLIFPCNKAKQWEWKEPRGTEPYSNKSFSKSKGVEGIFILGNSSNWANDIQLSLDFLIGDPPKKMQQVPLYITDDDVVVRSSHELPRINSGAFRQALGVIYESLTGTPLKFVPYESSRSILLEYGKIKINKLKRACGSLISSQGQDLFYVTSNMNLVRAAQIHSYTSVLITGFRGEHPVPALKPFSIMDVETEWLVKIPALSPPYVAPNCLAFVQELLTLPRDVIMLSENRGYNREHHSNPTPLNEMYAFDLHYELSNCS